MLCLIKPVGKKVGRTVQVTVDPEAVSAALLTNKVLELPSLTAGQRVTARVVSQTADGLVVSFLGFMVRVEGVWRGLNH